MSQYFLDNLTFGNDTYDLHDTEARQLIANNTQNITALSARVTQNANDIDALEETTAELREDLDSVEDRVTVNEGEIDALKTRTTSLEGRMNSAETRLDGHDTDIASLQNRMTAAEEDIDLLETRMLDAETDIDALEDRMDAVEQKNTEQDAAIDDLDDRVTQNTADIVDIKDDIEDIQDDIQDLDDRITASTYEAGIGIYFGQGEHHTNINVEDELLDQINQNTIDIDILKNRTLPTGGTAGKVLKKVSSTDYDVEWADDALGTLIYHKEGSDIIFDETALLKNFTKNMIGHSLDYNMVDGRRVYAMYPQETLDGAGVRRLKATQTVDLNDLYSTTTTPANNQYRGTLLLSGASQYLLNAPSGLQTIAYATEGEYGGVVTENWIKVLVYNQDNSYANILDVDPVVPGQVPMDTRLSVQKVFDLIGGDVYYRYYDWQKIEDPSNPGTLIRKGWSAWKKLTGGGSGGASALNDLTDVTITSPAAGQKLAYNGTAWVNDNGNIPVYTSSNINTFVAPTGTAKFIIDDVAYTDLPTAARAYMPIQVSTAVIGHYVAEVEQTVENGVVQKRVVFYEPNNNDPDHYRFERARFHWDNTESAWVCESICAATITTAASGMVLNYGGYFYLINEGMTNDVIVTPYAENTLEIYAMLQDVQSFKPVQRIPCGIDGGWVVQPNPDTGNDCLEIYANFIYSGPGGIFKTCSLTFDGLSEGARTLLVISSTIKTISAT